MILKLLGHLSNISKFHRDGSILGIVLHSLATKVT